MVLRISIIKALSLSIAFVASILVYGNENIPENVNKYLITTSSVGFVENKGQFVDEKGNPVPFVFYKATLNSMNIYITDKGITYVFLESIGSDVPDDKKSDEENTKTKRMWRAKQKDRLVKASRMDMNLIGATIKKQNIEPFNSTEGHFNYFPEHCPDGIYNVKSYRSIIIKSVYKGIDWILYFDKNKKGLKYDFIVHPDANPNDIRLNYEGTGQIEALKDNKCILIKTPLGDLQEGELSCYQNNHKQVNSYYDVKGNDVSFIVENYDTKQTLVIDPPVQIMRWATYYGGDSWDGPKAITADKLGNIFISGYSSSTNFPTYDPGGGAYYNGTNQGVFISKFSKSGVLNWCTYYGGVKTLGIVADSRNDIYILGWTAGNTSTYARPGAYNQAISGGGGGGDKFILKFSNSGVRLWGTFFGGNGDDQGFDNCGSALGRITIDKKDNLYITGATSSTNFPVQNSPGAYFQDTLATDSAIDIVISKFDSAGVLKWSTYYGGNDIDIGHSLAVDSKGNLYVTGNTLSTDFPLQNMAGSYNQTTYGGGQAVWGDAFILKFDSNGTRQWATYYGGNGIENGYDIITDVFDNVYAVGSTRSTNFYKKNYPGAYNKTNLTPYGGAYILKFRPTGTQQWGTLFEAGMANCITSDSTGNIYITGQASGNTFPKVNPGNGAYYQSTCKGNGDIYISQFTPAGVLYWSTFFGGNGSEFPSDIDMDKKGCLLLTGEYMSTSGSPLLDPGGGAYYQSIHGGAADDGFIAKFCSQCYLNIIVKPDVQTICVGDSVTFTSTTITSDTFGTNTITYQWMLNGVPIHGGGDSTLTINSAGLGDSGSYSCVVVSSCDSTVSNIAILNVYDLPDIDLGNDTLLCEGKTLLLTPHYNGISYFWQDGSTNPTYLANTTGFYWVEVTDTNGCKARDEIKLLPCPPEINIPNVFTPNADAVNDEFYADGENIGEFSMMIFNRWGRLIFESDNIDKHWDGTSNGNLCADGVYYWIVNYKGKNINSKSNSLHGTVTLIR